MIRKILDFVPGLRSLMLPTSATSPPRNLMKEKSASSSSQDSFGNFYSKTGSYDGHKAPNGMFTDENGAYVGQVNKDGTFIDRFGIYAGRITAHGTLTGKKGQYLGRLSPSGAITGRNGQYISQVSPGNHAAAFNILKKLENTPPDKKKVPLLGITGWSGTGKTTLLKQLIPLLIQENIRVGIIKHSHHKMDVDTPGKDSYELRKAGAGQTLVASARRWALMTETPEEKEPDLQFLASRMDKALLDLILVEGFKRESIPKIQLFRKEAGHSINDLPIDKYSIAIASDLENGIETDPPLPQLDLNNPLEISRFIQNWLKQNNEN